MPGPGRTPVRGASAARWKLVNCHNRLLVPKVCGETYKFIEQSKTKFYKAGKQENLFMGRKDQLSSPTFLPQRSTSLSNLFLTTMSALYLLSVCMYPLITVT